MVLSPRYTILVYQQQILGKCNNMCTCLFCVVKNFRLLCLFFQPESPAATARCIGYFRKTADTFTGDTAVDGTGETGIFYFAYRFTGMERHTFAFACPLYPALPCPVNQCLSIIFPKEIRFIQVGIET